ncbi:GDSL-type esterase/lipase family protein [Rhizobium leguminosarum]|uniref:GDSL-type esterase/lipase family protein n=1 Tax=Rhizobium leguminosarum TaxID=384 RepID=UPI0012F7C66C|nr:GDSL-type esterase/lipase family protein [Rhizobium leguminosarum]MVO95505.1 hypothetical protein [Rhizobium leguminosarum bv. phaseoli]
MEIIDRATLEAMLTDPEVPEAAIRPYLKLDPLESQAFRPVVVINRARVQLDGTESAMALASLNGLSRWRRQKRYRAKIGGWKGLKVLEEGDSWHQYPFLLDDIVDQQFDRWAIYSVSGAGDLLSDMAKQDELTAAIVAEQPDVVMLSGGGNDLLGDGRLSRYLLQHEDGKEPAEHIGPEFDATVGRIIVIYRDLIDKALAAGARRVVCHSYDYAIPNGGPWLGRPMLKLGIVDHNTQRAIVRILIDRFHAALTSMALDFGGAVVVADCRGAVKDSEWYDELHPTNPGFARVARIIQATVEGSTVESTDAGGGLENAEAPRPLPVADREAVLNLIAASDLSLLAEIGRRATVIDHAPDAAFDLTLELPAGGLEGLPMPFVELGKRIVDRLHRELYQLLCGDGGSASAERNKLRSALKLEQAAMIGAITTALITLSVPVLIAPLAAALIVKSGIEPTWEETCRLWGEKLG